MVYTVGFNYNAHMKRKWIFVLALCLLSCTVQSSEKEKIRYQAPDFTAAVISDLHYTSSPSTFNSVVPLEPIVPEVTDALIEQVIAKKPDAFIMTGDNTSSGEEKDVKELSQKLQKLKKAGIEVIITTGNHDYGQNEISRKAWECYILPLLDIKEQDPASYSYITENSRIMILAMDDSHPGDSAGQFSEKTMEWLKIQLETAESKGLRVLFLSHHNILSGKISPMYSSYLIRNEDLVKILETYNVQLCMTGHQHNQAVWQKDDMYEILNGMPLQPAHTFGWLKMDEKGVSYHTEEIDLKAYGAPGIYEKAMDLIERQSSSFYSSFEELCNKKNLSAEETEKVLNLMEYFFSSAGQGKLAEDAEQIMHHPDYELMMSVLRDTNYGPWIEGLLKNPPADASELRFEWI